MCEREGRGRILGVREGANVCVREESGKHF